MKNITKLVIVVIITSFAMYQFAACSSVHYWEVNQYGTISTNDVARLQNEVPFNIILPKYLPDGLNSYKLDMVFHYNGQFPTLSIDYSSPTKAIEIQINEGPPEDQIPRPLPPGLFAQMNPDYTPIELGGIEILEDSGFGIVIRSGKQIQVSGFFYLWERNDIEFSVVVLGLEQADAKKIVESMIQQ